MDGTWGTVCSNNFYSTAAEVVCRMLNLPGPAYRHRDAYYGAGNDTTPIVLGQVVCNDGQETSLDECNYITSHDCSHADDVGVACGIDAGAFLQFWRWHCLR